MDPIIYFLAAHYPWWGIPLAFCLFELGNTVRRRGAKFKAVLLFIFSFVLMALAGAYFAFNGLERLLPSMQKFEKNYLN